MCFADLSGGTEELLKPQGESKASLNLDIPGQALESALVEFALQANIDFIVSSELVADYRSVPLVGYYSLEVALDQFLGRAPLAYKISKDGVVLSFDEEKARNLMPPTDELKGEPLRLIDEMLVTSRRREESLFDVPLSMTAVDGDIIESQGIDDFFKFGLVTPNLTVTAMRSTNSTMTAFIRGIGQEDPLVGFESGVGIYIDDVYINRPQGILADLYDTGSIEVLRGPQGTFYGQNSIGGAIKYVSKPLSDKSNVNLKLGVGTYNQREATLSAGTAFADARFKLGGAIASRERDGFGTNLITGAENYDKNIRAYRLSSEYLITDNLNLKFSMDKSKDRSSPKVGRNLWNSQLYTSEVSHYDNFSEVTLFSNPYNDFSMDSSGGSIKFNWDYDDFQIKTIHGYREDKTQVPIDLDTAQIKLIDVYVGYENNQTSHELQFLKSTDKYHIILGLYYLNADAYNVFDVVSERDNAVSFSIGDVTTKSKAVFLNFDYNLYDNFILSIGSRYTKEKKYALINRDIFVNNGDSDLVSPYFGGELSSVVEPVFDEDGNEVVPQFSGSREDSILTPRMGISWYPYKSLHTYFTYSKGYKGAGFDPRGNYAFAEIREGFSPETLDSYELGFKTKFSNSEINAAIFLNNYNSIQIGGGIIVDNDGVPEAIGAVSNNASANAEGIEIEYKYTPVSGVNLGLSFGWVDHKYDRYIYLGYDASESVNFIKSPKVNGALYLSYHQDLYGGVLSANLSSGYRGEEYFGPYIFDNITAAQPSYWVTNIGAMWESQDKKYSFSLHANNIFDERYITSLNYFIWAEVGTVYYGDPRTVTASMTFKF